MKRTTLIIVLSILSSIFNSQVTQQAHAAGCLATFPDSAWGSQNPIGNSGQPDAVIRELLGPNGTGNQKLILKSIEVVQGSNSFKMTGFNSVGQSNSTGTIWTDIDFILQNKLTYYTLKSDFTSVLTPVIIRYTYAGLDCDMRTVTTAGGIKYQQVTNMIPINDNKQIVNALLAAFPAENFVLAQSDFDTFFAPFSKFLAATELNPIKVTSSQFVSAPNIFLIFGPGGNGFSGYYLTSDDGCVIGTPPVNSNYYFDERYGPGIPLPKYFSASDDSAKPSITFNSNICKLNILIPIGWRPSNYPFSDYSGEASRLITNESTPIYASGTLWIENDLNAAADKAAADKAAADMAAADMAAAASIKAQNDRLILKAKDFVSSANIFLTQNARWGQVNTAISLPFGVVKYYVTVFNDIFQTYESNHILTPEQVSKIYLGLSVGTEDLQLTSSRIATYITTVTCIKGKLIKTVTAFKPVCPAGYKKK